MATGFKQTIKQWLPAPILKRLQSANRQLWLMRHPDARNELQAMRRLKEEFVERINLPRAARSSFGRAYNSKLTLLVPERSLHFAGHREAYMRWTAFWPKPPTGAVCSTSARSTGFSRLYSVRADQKTAYAFEPSPQPFEVLSYNAAANHAFNIRPNQLAIGNTQGELQMNYEWQHSSPRRPNQILRPQPVAFRVPVTTMDTFCAANGVEPDTIKIDVEGFEFQVLQGAKEVIRRARPLMFIEIHPIALANYGMSLTAVWELLRSLDYTILDINRQPLANPTPLVKQTSLTSSAGRTNRRERRDD